MADDIATVTRTVFAQVEPTTTRILSSYDTNQFQIVQPTDTPAAAATEANSAAAVASSIASQGIDAPFVSESSSFPPSTSTHITTSSFITSSEATITSVSSSKPSSTEISSTSAVGGVLLLILGLVLFFCMRRRRRASEKSMAQANTFGMTDSPSSFSEKDVSYASAQSPAGLRTTEGAAAGTAGKRISKRMSSIISNNPKGYARMSDDPENAAPNSNAVYEVIMDFHPSMTDELRLQKGQRLNILHQYEDEWCLASLQNSPDVKGVVPRVCLSVLPVSSSATTIASNLSQQRPYQQPTASSQSSYPNVPSPSSVLPSPTGANPYASSYPNVRR
ncbi:hypothetical protein CANCADRAFT_94755 [Tortispora caseinolytica NRRL Y-17796]|uniref:SH3 domain-containing protein n=1 Tax=Tortispora caseinolytica NRRL Y-17796 TaxID=767744 RepID=A0A1E4TMK9_9ASCO|nr:hypothetical protein CANCADRAFT_94755 [Tortispora caseinolytica NRRL Y-17796]